MKGTVVIALGGNALIRPGQTGRLEELMANALGMAESVRDLVESDWRVVLVHGNGPIGGNLPTSRRRAPPSSLLCPSSSWTP